MKVSSKPLLGTEHDGPRINRFVPYHNEIAAIGTLNFQAFCCVQPCVVRYGILVAASDDFRATFTWYGNQYSGCFTLPYHAYGRVSGSTACSAASTCSASSSASVSSRAGSFAGLFQSSNVRPCLRRGMNLLSTVLFPRERT